MLPRINIQEGAYFISDAHYNSNRECFLYLLEELDCAEETAPQIFLMGDMFDLLVGEVKQTHIFNEKVIKHLKSLSKKSEVYYFEGNHDFNLSLIFQDMQIFKMANQPVEAKFEDKTLLLSHGDYKVGGSYQTYSNVIRNSRLLKILNVIDRVVGGFITTFIIKKHREKLICKKFEKFREYLERKLHFLADIHIEGHYHQDREFEFGKIRYINLPAFACNQSYVVVNSHDRNNLFSKVSFKDHRCKPMMKH